MGESIRFFLSISITLPLKMNATKILLNNRAIMGTPLGSSLEFRHCSDNFHKTKTLWNTLETGVKAR